MFKRNYYVFLIFLVAMLGFFISCDSPTSSDSSETEGRTLNNIISSIPESKVDLPDSIKPANYDQGVSYLNQGVSPYNASAEVGVMGHILKDIISNFALDLNVLDANVSGLWGRVFALILKDAAQDIDFVFDQEIVLGERYYPTGTMGPSGETITDFGKIIITQPSEGLNIFYWTFPVDNYGTFYIKFILEEQSDADKSLAMKSYLILDPSASPGNIVNYIYEYINPVIGEVLITESNYLFHQYTDSSGYLRSIQRGNSEDYPYLYMMIGDANFASSVTHKQYNDGSSDLEYVTVEAYDESGNLLKQLVSTTNLSEIEPTTMTKNYPLKMLSKSGYTMMFNDISGQYWMDEDATNTATSLEGNDIDLGTSVVSSVSGSYVQWDGVSFTDKIIDLWTGTSTLPEVFDSSTNISEIENIMFPWYVTENAYFDVGISMDDLGFPADVSDFPTL